MSGRSRNHRINAIWLYWMRKRAYHIARSHKYVSVENLRRCSETLARRGITADSGMWAHIFRDRRFHAVDSYRVSDCDGGRRVRVYSLDKPHPVMWCGIAMFGANTRTAGRYR